MSWKLPSSCPVCSAMGYVFPDYGYPELMTCGEWNCGTRAKRLNESPKTDHNPQLYIRGNCYRRFLEQWREKQNAPSRMAA